MNGKYRLNLKTLSRSHFYLSRRPPRLAPDKDIKATTQLPLYSMVNKLLKPLLKWGGHGLIYKFQLCSNSAVSVLNCPHFNLLFKALYRRHPSFLFATSKTMGNQRLSNSYAIHMNQGLCHDYAGFVEDSIKHRTPMVAAVKLLQQALHVCLPFNWE